MEKKIYEEEKEKKLLKHQLDESLENSHELSLLNERLNENEKELLENKVKSKHLELRNEELSARIIQLHEDNDLLQNQVNDLESRNNDLL